MMKSIKRRRIGPIALSLAQFSLSLPAATGVSAQSSADLMRQTQQQSSRVTQTNEPASQNTEPAATPTATAAPPKKPGGVRIGVLPPRAQMGQGNMGVDIAEPMRQILITYMSGPAVEVLPLTARIPVQIEAEMKQKECDYVLATTVTKAQKKNGFGSFLRKAAPIAAAVAPIGMLGMAGGAAASAAAISVAAASAGVVSAGAELAGAMAGSVSAKDEFILEYSLVPAGSTTPKLSKTQKAKATKDGEDVLTPMIEQAATTVVSEAVKK